MTRWLITGGAGYIGAHVADAMLASGRDVTVLDDLSSGRRAFAPPDARVVVGSILDHGALEAALEDADGVVHLAGCKYAGESVRRPLHTWRQNVSGTIELLEAMHERGVARMVFSSSAGVYGTPDVDRVTEATPPAPESPYGESKLAGELLLADERRRAALANEPFQAVALRYFNVVGSATDRIRDTSPHNLVPAVLAVLARGEQPQINGDDYPTADGTCVRDWVHVGDVALAHVAAAERMERGLPLEPVYNLGSGEGASVRQVLDAVGRALGTTLEPRIAPRRPGDPARIVADGSLAERDLGWRMRHGLDAMVASAVRVAQAA
ncbi:UDP-glucose 4-epimerase GalE [Agrococcus baldri]|uniref:UDP-glucose 4-epimerase n=1 Tax=Agrococcus baldri TaxID=153730 RepID=A0AA87RF99_9MICO|nr:UDP-glucose 4-epimerase GalE [Agrococcus baldri]GEK79481.1 UDP-glucose 4-epimerase GalE [Agrococcus baldri]